MPIKSVAEVSESWGAEISIEVGAEIAKMGATDPIERQYGLFSLVGLTAYKLLMV
jgi:hypothetical protein